MWLFLPVWLCWIIILLLPAELQLAGTPDWIWVIFVLGIDVSHVWSTLFRTYIDKEEFQRHRKLLIYTPILAFLGAYLFSAISISLFWRLLAYIAVFHFVKQQYGFMKIYKAKAADFGRQWIGDNFIIYTSMLYPIIFWHFNSNREFSWFMPGDFVQFSITPGVLEIFNGVGGSLYIGLLSLWLIQEIYLKYNNFPWGKVLWVLTTAVNWFFGIVYFNSDWIFTVTNVIAHGIPYLSLILFYQHSKFNLKNKKFSKVNYLIVVFGGVLLLASLEEFLWDLFVNGVEHSFFRSIIDLLSHQDFLAWAVPATAVLSVPQITHYILDGYIWKSNEKNPYLKPVLFKKASQESQIRNG